MVFSLHNSPKRIYLSTDFWTRNPSQDAWMAGAIKKKRTLKQYFIDPTIREDGTEKIITGYIITGKGGVEKWLSSRACLLELSQRRSHCEGREPEGTESNSGSFYVDLHDKDKHTPKVVDKLCEFFGKNL